MNTVGIRAVSMKTMRARCRKMMVGDRIFTFPILSDLGALSPTNNDSVIFVSATDSPVPALRDFIASRCDRVVTAA
jgi:hypothetical protein